MASEEQARRTLNRFIISFQAALAGPPLDESDPEIARIEGWETAVVGSNLILIGRTSHHPRLGRVDIWTSRLIHITSDLRWARTVSRWYALGKPFLADLHEHLPGAAYNGFSISASPDLVTVPMDVAARAMRDCPNLMRKLAAGSACKDLVPQFEEIEAKWPPADGVTRHRFNGEMTAWKMPARKNVVSRKFFSANFQYRLIAHDQQRRRACEAT